MRTVVWSLILSAVIALTPSPSHAQQDLRLVPVGATVSSTTSFARVWTGPKTPGRAGVRDLVTWTSATGELRLVIVGHPTRSGDDGRIALGGDCTTHAVRPDLAGTVMTAMWQDDGPDILVFTKHEGDRIVTVLRAYVLPGAGCDTSDQE